MFGLQILTVRLQLHSATWVPLFLVSHDSLVSVTSRSTGRRSGARSRCWLANYCSLVHHGCFKASRAAVWDWTTPVATGSVSGGSHSARSRGGLPMEPQQDEGKEGDRGAENTWRQRQPRAGPGRRIAIRPRAGEHGNASAALISLLPH